MQESGCIGSEGGESGVLTLVVRGPLGRLWPVLMMETPRTRAPGSKAGEGLQGCMVGA